MKEIEILVEVFSKKEDVLNILNKFNFIGKKEVLDIYFYDEQRNSLKPKQGRLTECFRLRKKDKTIYVAYKTDKFDNDGYWLYSDEEETEVKDFYTMIKIISNLGLKQLIRIDNIKHTFLSPDYEIVLEEVKDLGIFLEVEKRDVNDNKEILLVKQEILKFIDSLGIKHGGELNAGKPELMLKKKRRITL
jgi:adenylate cyclase class 2